jgi:ribosome modulation factor
MIKSRGMKFRDEDDAHDYFVQRDLDNAAALQDAYLEGAKAGRQGLSASLNPWQDYTEHHAAWQRGWFANQLNRRTA